MLSSRPRGFASILIAGVVARCHKEGDEGRPETVVAQHADVLASVLNDAMDSANAGLLATEREPSRRIPNVNSSTAFASDIS
jgi:hypothetical protein